MKALLKLSPLRSSFQKTSNALTCFVCLLFFLANSYPKSGWATSFIQVPFDQTVQDAPVIVRGTVGPSHSDWGSGLDGVRRLYTYTQLTVGEVVKGNVPQKSIQIREMGGTRDGLTLEVSGTARFKEGEEIVIMLSPANRDGSHDIRGMMMGKFEVKKDDSGREFLTGPGLAENSHETDQHDGMHGDAPRPLGTPVPLEALRTLVKQQLQQTQPSQPSAAKTSIPAGSASPAEKSVQGATPQRMTPQNAISSPGPEAESRSKTYLKWASLALVAFFLIRMMLSRRS